MNIISLSLIKEKFAQAVGFCGHFTLVPLNIIRPKNRGHCFSVPVVMINSTSKTQGHWISGRQLRSGDHTHRCLERRGQVYWVPFPYASKKKERLSSP